MRRIFIFWTFFLTTMLFAEENIVIEFDDLFDYGDLAKTEATYKRILNDATEANDTARIAAANIYLAQVNLHGGKYEVSESHLTEVEKLLPLENAVLEVKYYTDRGVIQQALSGFQPGVGRDYFVQAWNKVKERKVNTIALSVINTLIMNSEPEEKIELAKVGIEFFENSGSPNLMKDVPILYKNLGWNYHKMGNDEAGIKMAQKALEMNEKREFLPEIISSKWVTAAIHRSLGNLDEALKLQTELIEEPKLGEFEQEGLVMSELGEIYLAKGDEAKAKEYFGKAYEILNKTNGMALFPLYDFDEADAFMNRLVELGE